MIEDKEQRFRQIITRFGQLPLLVLIIIIYALSVYALHNDSFIGRADNVAMDMVQFYYAHDPRLTQGFFELLKRWPAATVLLSFSLFLSYFFGSFIKLCYFKQRPNEQTYKNIFQKIDASSFPSVHTANSFIFAFFGVYSFITHMAFVGAVLWFLLFMSISLSRIALKKHYPIDLLGGVVFGIGIISVVSCFGPAIMRLALYILHIFG